MDDRIVNSNKISALVVDDNGANTLMLKTMLERYDIETDTAESGMEAIEKACGKKYNMIFMDYLMPDMDGVEAVRQIKFVSDSKDDSIIYGVSATVDDQLKELFESVGADGVLRKPVKTDEIEQLLREFDYSASSMEIADEESEDESEISFLAGVEGLNYQEGLSLMAGSLENYMKVLYVCVKNVMENYSLIDAVRNTEQMETMALHFHSLKGIFLNIGADELAEESKMLEFAAKELENLYVHQQMDGYLYKVKMFHDQLESACNEFKQSSGDNSGGEQMPASEFMSNINKLKEYIQNFEYIDIIELIEKMLGVTSAQDHEYLSEVYDCVQNFEYDLAMDILKKISDR